MSTWRVAAVQMDCQLGQLSANLSAVRFRLRQAAEQGAKLIVFPECILTGYGFSSRAEALHSAEPIPGPASNSLVEECKALGVWAVVGMLELAGEKLFNTALLIGPDGTVRTYRKIHLPCVGADRFTDPGDRPFEVHDLGGLKVGIGICFDGSFPESARMLTLLGADLLLLPTNWADKALKMATLVARVRAFENHVYNMSVNRVGTESGYHYIGHSTICDYLGDWLAAAEHDQEAILFADINPEAARPKKVVHCVGEYEIDRVNWRRPEMYTKLTETSPPFTGHQNQLDTADKSELH
jgi:5-aminopentanamidase